MASLSTIPTDQFSTTDLPVERQFVVWRDRFAAIGQISRFDAETDTGFAAVHRGAHLGDLVITSLEADPFRLSRSADTIKHNAFDIIIITAVLDGEIAVTTDHHRSVAKAGNIFILDLQRRFQMCAKDTKAISIFIQQDKIDSTGLIGSQLNGRVLDRNVSRFFIEQAKLIDSYLFTSNGPPAETTVRILLEAANMIIRNALQIEQEAYEPVQADRLNFVKAYIDEHLQSPNLNPKNICSALSISRSSLYALFEPYGGVTSYVQSRRLIKVHSALQSGDGFGKIYEVAYRYGFTNVSHFNRAFKAKFGITPKDVRVNRHRPVLKSSDKTGHFSQWLLQL